MVHTNWFLPRQRVWLALERWSTTPDRGWLQRRCDNKESQKSLCEMFHRNVPRAAANAELRDVTSHMFCHNPCICRCEIYHVDSCDVLIAELDSNGIKITIRTKYARQDNVNQGQFNQCTNSSVLHFYVKKCVQGRRRTEATFICSFKSFACMCPSDIYLSPWIDVFVYNCIIWWQLHTLWFAMSHQRHHLLVTHQSINQSKDQKASRFLYLKFQMNICRLSQIVLLSNVWHWT